MRWTVALSIWTLFVWGGRVRNIADDASLDGFEIVWRLGLAVSFVTLAIATLTLLWRSGDQPSARLGHVVRWFALFTGAVWIVRAVGILLDGSHAAGFKVVHTVLALVSIALAWQADREVHGRSASMVAAPPRVAS